MSSSQYTSTYSNTRPVVHQTTHGLSSSGSSSSGSRSSSHSSAYSSSRSTMDYASSSSGPAGFSQFRSGKADGYMVNVIPRGGTTVINHHRANPDYDEPRSSEAGSYDINKSRRHGSSKKSSSSSSSHRSS